MKVKIKPVSDFWAPPQRKHANDVGADVVLPRTLMLPGAETVRAPLGFSVDIPAGYAGFIFPRSGMSSAGISCELAPIDPGYTGEVHAIVTNHRTTDEVLTAGTRIGQLVILPCVIADFEEYLGPERGTGAFGSTDEEV